MHLTEIISEAVVAGVKALYETDFPSDKVNINQTRKEFEGDFTVVVFPFTKIARKKPEQIGEELGQYLVDQVEEISGFNVIKGFLNLSISAEYWQGFLNRAASAKDYGQLPPNGKKVMVEFSSPNTNKPLHLGHIRNILLGWSTSRILEAAGYDVVKVQIVNDRGIAICKSMLAWQQFAEGATPASTGIKGDHFVGKYYVLFEQKFQEEYKAWQLSTAAASVFSAAGKEGESQEAFFKRYKNSYFNEYSELGKAAKALLVKWEDGDAETVALWKKLNDWVYEGFNDTYHQLGVDFDKIYYESDTYVLGKDLIQRGLSRDVFYQKEDGSVWIDLEDAKLDHKLVLRSDGTSVYMTQDIGTAHLRYEDFGVDKMVYVVADEQNYHFQVLFEILKRLGEPYAEGLHHLSYGMVELPEGKMKSREGTVVDADDLIAEVIREAHRSAEELNSVSEDAAAQAEVDRKVGLAALKFFMIKVQPKKWMTFDPKESVDMQGQTGPYIQYSYVRIKGILERAAKEGVALETNGQGMQFAPAELELLRLAYHFPEVIAEAATNYEPSEVANFCYATAKAFSKFWHDVPIFDAPEQERAFRLQLSKLVGHILEKGMDLLGIEMPERM
jgi:arginyl-tRNA synthetase